MNGYAIGIVVSLLVYVVVGNWAGRKVKKLDDYLVAGRRAPTLLILGTLVASAVGTNSFLGDAGFVYSGYAVAMIMQIPIIALGYVFGSLFFGRYIRRAGTRTVAEFFGRRFLSRRIRAFAAFTVIVGLGGYLMTVTQGSALIVSAVTPFSYTTALLAVWFGYTAFTVYAGSRGVVITDTIMFLFFSVVALLALAFIVDASGGWFATVQQLATTTERAGIIGAEGYMGPGRTWDTTFDMWSWSVILGIAWGVVFAISPWQSSRYLMARDEHVVIRSGLATAIVLSIFWPVIQFAGAAIVLANADIRPLANAMIWAAQNLMPLLAGALLLAGIVSAGLSSASTFLTLVGFAITNDLVDASRRNDRQNLLASRLAILGVGLAALGVALVAPPSIFWITNFVGPSFAASWGPLAFMSVWSKRITEAGAFWGMVTGFFACVLPKALVTASFITLPVILDPIVIGALASILTIVFVSRAGAVSEAEQGFREQLHVAPAELADAGKKRGTLLWPKLLIAWGIVTMVGLVVVYVRPYQLATGLIDTGGAYVTWSGELLVVLAFGLTLVAGGLLAHATVKRILA